MRTNFITFCREAYLADTREGRVNLPRVISDLIGNKKTTFTKVLRSADKNTDEGRNVWERVTE
eukprot:scaffold359484_cov301-Cyclotella_meneghiniana.AAC.1